jgi:hypothetical protein
MGKRSKDTFAQVSKDYWPTIDPRAIPPIADYVQGLRYAEPMCGQGHLIELIGDVATCLWASDIHVGDGYSAKPKCHQRDATTIDLDTFMGVDCIISNPPFQEKMLLPILDHLMQSSKPSWLLLPADRLHVKYMSPYLQKCEMVLSIGRLKWFANDDPRLWDDEKQAFKKNTDPTDNYAWFKFTNKKCDTTFKGRLQ